MNEFDKARPVSGEIMTEPSSAPGITRQAGFSDAEYETVEPRRDDPPPRFAAAKMATGMDSLKQGMSVAKRTKPEGGPLFWMTGLVLVVLAFWVSGGHSFVRQTVLSAPIEAGQPLRIADVRSRVELHEGRDILFVDGLARNEGPSTLKLPPLEIVVFGNDGSAIRYFLGTNDAQLAPGDEYTFSSRLEAPRNGVKTVSVTFQEVNH